MKADSRSTTSTQSRPALAWQEVPAARSVWIYIAAAAVRTAFGLVWTIDAYLKWQPEFQYHYLDYITGIVQGQPGWLMPWFNFWVGLIQLSPRFFAVATATIESLIAIGLLFGLLRKPVYILGILFALLIWMIPEGFGGPYASGSTDVGAGLIYVFLFVALIVMQYVLGRSPYSVDNYIEKRVPAWKAIAESAPAEALEHEPPRLSWGVQLVIIALLVIMLAVFLAVLASEMKVNPPATGLLNLRFTILD
jgi:nitrite reductase (NO-forming)